KPAANRARCGARGLRIPTLWIDDLCSRGGRQRKQEQHSTCRPAQEGSHHCRSHRSSPRRLSLRPVLKPFDHGVNLSLLSGEVARFLSRTSAREMGRVRGPSMNIKPLAPPSLPQGEGAAAPNSLSLFLGLGQWKGKPILCRGTSVSCAANARQLPPYFAVP